MLIVSTSFNNTIDLKIQGWSKLTHLELIQIPLKHFQNQHGWYIDEILGLAEWSNWDLNKNECSNILPLMQS